MTEPKKNEDGEVIGNAAATRNKKMEEIAARAEELDPSEDVADEDHDKLTEIKEEEEKVAVKEEVKPEKRKFKVNGQEIELTEQEVAEWVQKGQSADHKFQEAAKLKKEAEELVSRAPVKTDPVKDAEEDDVALARAIQMGSEEEAVAAIKKIKSRPSVKPEDVARIAGEQITVRLSFEAQKQKFMGDYKDLMDDPKWRDRVLDREEYLAFKGEAPGYDRMKKAGDYVRDLKAEGTPASSLQQKQERKASLSVVTGASVRQAPTTDEDKEESPSEVIAGMAKARQGRVIGGGNI
jgi:hypothetical protein